MSYKFGSFNVHNFSWRADKKKLEGITKIIKGEQFDVIALQEVLDENAVKKLVGLLGTKYSYKWREPGKGGNTSTVGDKRGEGFAFIWRNDRMKIPDVPSPDGKQPLNPRILTSEMGYSGHRFARTPFYAVFVPVNGGNFEFRIVNVHLYYGDTSTDEVRKRKMEYKYLVENVYPTISQRRYGSNRTAYTIVMGDYNLNLAFDRGADFTRIKKNTLINSTDAGEEETNPIKKHVVTHKCGDQLISTVQYELTSLKTKDDTEPDDKNPDRGYSQNYDHFTFDTRQFGNYGIRCSFRRIDAVRKYYDDDFMKYKKEVSDHIPVSITLAFDEELRITSGNN